MDPFPPVALLCCILTVSIKCVDMENLSGLDPLCAEERNCRSSDERRSCTKLDQMAVVFFLAMATKGMFRERPEE